MVKYAVAYCDMREPDNFMVDHGPDGGFANALAAMNCAEDMSRQAHICHVTPFAYKEGDALDWDYAIRREIEFAVAYKVTGEDGREQLYIQTGLHTYKAMVAAATKLDSARTVRELVWLPVIEKKTMHRWEDTKGRDIKGVPEEILG